MRLRTYTTAFEREPHSSIDPDATEITWIAFELVAADLASTNASELRARWSRVHEVLFALDPGRAIAVTEAARTGPRSKPTMRFAVAMVGPESTTRAELLGLAPVLERVIGNDPYTVRSIHPGPMFPDAFKRPPSNPEHMIRIAKDTVCVTVDDHDGFDIAIPRPWRPVVDVWGAVLSILESVRQPVRVRSTILNAHPLRARRDLERLAEVMHWASTDIGPIHEREWKRNIELLHHLERTLTSPVGVAEIVITSPSPMPTPLLHHLATYIAGSADIERHDGYIVTASPGTVINGGYVLDPCPEATRYALDLGVPLAGGLVPPRTSDFHTLFEIACGFPTSGATLPTTAAARPPVELRTSTAGVTPLSTRPAVGIPLDHRPLGCAFIGAPGSGKTTAMLKLAEADLAERRGFLFFDVHGQAATHLSEWADALGVAHLRISNRNPRNRFAPISALTSDADRHRVETETTHLVDAIAASMPADWTGPRFRSFIRAAGEVAAVHRLDMHELAACLLEPSTIRSHVAHPHVSELAASVLLNAAQGSDAATMLGWATSKLSDLAAAHTVLAPPGDGISICDTIAADTPIIVDLAGLGASEILTIGSLLVSLVLEAGIARGVGAPLYTVYLDELARVAGAEKAITRAVLEARKFMAVCTAVQSLTVLPPSLADLVATVGTHVLFQSTPQTAEVMAPLLGVPTSTLTSLAPLHGLLKVAHHQPIPIKVDTPAPAPGRPEDTTTPTALLADPDRTTSTRNVSV